MNYSPCGKMLAVGTHTQDIIIYDVDNNYAVKGKLKGHSSYILGLDWSIDGKYLRSNCGAYELLFWEIEKMAQDKNGMTNTKGVTWETSTCKISYNALGMFPTSEDFTHVNTVCISNNGQYIICGDDWGLVNIYNNPAPKDSGAFCVSLRGHSEHVMRVIFNKDDSYIFSVGGYDHTLMQWKKA